VTASESVACDQTEEAAEPRGARPGAPCLNSHNSNEPPLNSDAQEVEKLLAQARKMGGSAHRTAYALRTNVQTFVSRVGIEVCAFICLTFGGGGAGPSCREATRKFNSFLTGALRARYGGGVRILERGEKRGRVHFHLLADVGADIRTGSDVEAIQKGDWRTANAALRAELAWLRRMAKRYGFGVIVDIQPVKSCDQAIARYLAKYVAKHIGRREVRDKAVRLVGYWGHASKERTVRSSVFSWNSPRAKLYRWQKAEFARRNGCADTDALKAKFGRRVDFWQRLAIMAIEPPCKVVASRTVDGEVEHLTLWDVWHADRLARCSAVAAALGCTQADAFSGLHLQQHVKRTIEFAVPRWSGVPVPRDDFEQPEQTEQTTVWSDGRVERI
jgi:hypothetical protein